MAYYIFDFKDVYVNSRYIRLRYIKTSPKNIKLTHIKSTVPASGKLGVNAGFFDDASQGVQSICIQNSSCVLGGGSSDFATGYYNNNSSGGHISKGTLVWDDAWRTYRLQVIENAGQLIIGNPDNYWAQGGFSMHLQSDTSWQNMLSSGKESVNDHAPNTNYNRTGLLYGNSLNIYLVISETTCTADEFRTACKYIDTNNGLQGIFLDGATATQMNVPASGYSWTSGSSRKLPAMIEVVHNVDL
ncbi:hypothetical protein P4H70_06690 [Paenibacillus ehimensis]|uniref:hypothetical protein n=1 Tax=Paenibacillus ehimensis TaxID=79264 RepID=UPI002BB06608|nr:hypothetical protein [Paenibacillus ehimensis]MEC0208635.1 hypothetical protein [Paenibacillus ehimensis]HWO95591.1 hypothetical protein [Bacillus sp. (in: firmicutes)]